MAPKFQVQVPSLTYNVAPTNIGEGYAAGITQAGKSIAGAISGIMGGVDAQGNVTHGVLEQNQTANDMLSWLATQKDAQGNAVLSQDAYNSIMGKSLGARQQVVGALMGQFQTNLQSQIEQARQIAVARASEAAKFPTVQYEQEQATKRQLIAAGLDPNKQTVTVVGGQPSQAEIDAQIAKKKALLQQSASNPLYQTMPTF